MATQRREPGSDGITAETVEHNTVFVDTSLDTHLAMLAFKSDTVSDFKKKIVLEHMQCFPNIMDIRIHSLKVQRNATFYHLPDSMYIWSAFHGVGGNWFLYADASNTSMCQLNTNSSELGLTKCTRMDVRNVDNSCRGISSDINKIQQTIPLSLSETIPGFTVKNSVEKTADIQNGNFSRMKCTETKSPSKKKRKRKRTEEDECRNLSSKDSDALFNASVTEAVMPGVVYCGKSMVDAVKEGLNLSGQQGEPTEVSCLNNDQSVLDNRVAFEGLSVPAVGEKNIIGSDKRKASTMLKNKMPENLMANPKEYELGHAIVSMDAQATALKIQDTENPISETMNIRKKKKKKARKLANNDIDKSGLFQPTTDHNVGSEKREPDEENQHSAGNGHIDIPVVENSKDTDSTDKKAKKKRKKSTLTNSDAIEVFVVEDQKNGTGENLNSFVRSEPDGIHKASSQVPSRQRDEKLEEKHEIAVKTDDPTRTTKDEGERINFKEYFVPCKVKNANIMPTGHNVGSEKRALDEENQHSAGNGHIDIPVEENSKDTDNTDKKAKKKRKEKTLTASDAIEDFLVEDQKNGTRENLISFVNSEPDGIHEASSQVSSRQNDENLQEKHEIAVKTDDPARTTKDEGERIKLKEHFVPCEVKNSNQSSMEMKSLEKVKTNDLPSVSMSTEVQSSSKLSADHESKNKSCVRKDSRQRQGDMVYNSDLSRRFSRDLKNGVKDSSTSVMPETNLRKPKEFIAESCILKKKNVSLVKSSLDKLPGQSGNRRSLFGLNVTNRMELKTPKKKSLLTKPGALFKDFSGESSGDENGAAHASGRTQSPSDSSSMSDHSMSESNLSQDSTRNGTSDAQRRSTGGNGTSKLNLVDSEEMTMDKILRSSKRFKKAKLIASQNEADQNESQLIESVPDSLPI